MTDIVYVIGSAGTHLVKIGTTNNGTQRLADLQRMNPLPLRLLWSTPGNYTLEFALHHHFATLRRHGEWFDFGDSDPVATVRDAITAGLAVRCGKTPHRTFRSPDEIWNAAQAKAVIEGRTMTDVLNEFLKNYISTKPREQPDGKDADQA